MRKLTVRVPVPWPGPQVAYADWRQGIGLLGPPGTGKTQFMARTGLSAPGAVLMSSSNPDLAWLTWGARDEVGPVWALNPRGVGGLPSNIGFSPITGCVDPQLAMENAGALVAASPRDPSGKDAHWDHWSKVLLEKFLHAAALAGDPDRTNILTVRAWVNQWAEDPTQADEPLRLLGDYGVDGWAEELDGMVGAAVADEKYATAVAGGAQAALAWLSDPALAAMACPDPELAFDVRTFLRERGTIYAIGSDTPHNPQAPYFSCLTNHLWSISKIAAADPDEPAACGLRLDPPLVMIVDEPLNNCRTPLDKWFTEGGGRGIFLVTGFQSGAQLPQGYGDHAGKVLLDAITVKMVFGGVTGELAQYVSDACGEHDTWHRASEGRGKVHTTAKTYPPERLQRLADGRALVLHRNTPPFEVDTFTCRAHPAYVETDPDQMALAASRARAAVEAGRARRAAAGRGPARRALPGAAGEGLSVAAGRPPVLTGPAAADVIIRGDGAAGPAPDGVPAALAPQPADGEDREHAYRY